MPVLSNIHTHSTWSDGADTAEVIVQEAIRRGFHTIGISDHITTPFDLSYCMLPGREAAYCREMRELKEKYRGQINVLTGIEYDYSCQNFGGLTMETDYVIGSMHYMKVDGEYFAVDHTIPIFQELLRRFGGNALELAKRYYNDLVEYTMQIKPDVVGHFDLPAKFGFVEETDAYRAVAEEALQAILQAVKVVEVNTGAISRGATTVQYPADFLLPMILEKGGEVILSSDAHRAEWLDFAFDQMEAKLKAAGFTYVVERCGDKFIKTKL